MPLGRQVAEYPGLPVSQLPFHVPFFSHLLFHHWGSISIIISFIISQCIYICICNIHFKYYGSFQFPLHHTPASILVGSSFRALKSLNPKPVPATAHLHLPIDAVSIREAMMRGFHKMRGTIRGFIWAFYGGHLFLQQQNSPGSKLLVKGGVGVVGSDIGQEPSQS